MMRALEERVTATTPIDSLMIAGGQWGDEGKGKIVDLLSAGFAAVVRSNGGHNAGHTVRFAERRFALHLIPSGIVHERVTCYLGAGMVIDPSALVQEIDRLEAEGVATTGRVFISPRAALILPTHRLLDEAREAARGDRKIGTTGRGIGPTYEDVARRRGLRAHLLADPTGLDAAARTLMTDHGRELELLYGAAPLDLEPLLAAVAAAGRRLAGMIRETGPSIRAHRAAGEPVLFEGAQGVLLDHIWGTFPYVTSSSCLPAGAATSCGIDPRHLGPTIGVMKAYVTRVGGGPFPSELNDEVGATLRERGAEFGTTTGRPRRCGWFDAVAARYAVEIGAIDAVALTKLDVLDGLPTIGVVTAYRLPDGTQLATVPADLRELEAAVPVVEQLPGWQTSTVGVTVEADLPAAARAYVAALERHLGVPVVIVSTGPRREETLFRGPSDLTRALRQLAGTPGA